jgi:DNA-binding transcriptional ArsR family regulator
MSRKLASELRSTAPLFAALGDPTRLHLVARLSGGEPLSITKLAHGTRLTRQAVTKHLHVLAHARIVRGARQGREQVWQLNPAQLQEARRCLDAISNQWDIALGRLKASLEE